MATATHHKVVIVGGGGCVKRETTERNESSVIPKGQLPTLPNSAREYPGHGAGSSCGKNLSTETWSTIGAQHANNYELAPMAKGRFVEVLTGGQNVPAAYFSYDASLNSKVHPVFDGANLSR
jgi:hydroxyacylglutathione hydrolase